MNHRTAPRPALAPLAALLLAVLVLTPVSRAQDYTYAVEIQGTLCGWADVKATTENVDGRARLVVTENVFVMLTALGSEVTARIDSTYRVDPATDRLTEQTIDIRQGDNDYVFRAVIEGDTARVTSSLSGAEKTVPLPEGTILDVPTRAPHLVRDLIERGLESATYPTLDVREGVVQDITFTRTGKETLELAGVKHDTLVVAQRNEVTGLEIRQWLDPQTGMSLKLEFPGGRSIYLADESVKGNVAVASLDSSLIHPVDVAIADVHAIELMRVRAVMEPTGLRVRADDLNVPGQRFEGTVDGNRIDGVFTIEHPRYAGTGAPPFPPRFGDDPDLAPFLGPEDRIESDDPVLVAHAKTLTAGAENSWEAAVELSAWVAGNISYVIPGGASARATFDTRAGECGAHSLLLAALCRGVGIPARVVWGCMYVPNSGGAFGQHAWNEVYMGEVGWVPVDSTAFENDFVDSGHLRIGTYQSLSTAINMREMDVLEHRLAVSATDPDALASFDRYVGEYAHPAGKDPFVVLIQGSALAVDIPGKVVLVLRTPDEAGRWYAKLTRRVFCKFEAGDGDGGDATALVLHELVQMPRRGDPEDVPEDAPAALRPFLGTYRFAAVRADFEVVFDEGGFGLHDPLEGVVVYMKPTKVPGQWIDELGKNRISFERTDDGAVRALLLDVANRFPRVQDAHGEATSPGAADVETMLTDLHRAAADADGDRWFAHFEPDAVYFGTDPAERWTLPKLRETLGPIFVAGTGWSTVPTAQHVYLSRGGEVAWFDEALKSERWGVMRGSGVAVCRDGHWRIAQYDTVFPIPNQLFGEVMKEVAKLPAPEEVEETDEANGAAAEVRDVLRAFHRAASELDRDAYFSKFAEDAVFLGTAADERRTLTALKEYSEPYFAGETGYERSSRDLHVFVADSGDVAWFDDRLQYGEFGDLRATGVLVHRDGAWKIVQFHLAVPVPNDFVPELVKQVGGDER